MTTGMLNQLQSFENFIEAVENIEELTIFEVDTTYKSGRKRTDMICAKSEEEMWLIYDKHHSKDKVDWCGICDCWPA